MKKAKINISIFILLFINFIFFYKYTSRYTDFSIYIGILLFVFQFLVFQFSHRIKISKKQITIAIFSLISLIIGYVALSYYAIPVTSLNVDRWSVITSFLTELYHGNYPYYAKSHLGNFPGPMPIYYLIAAPFFYLGELSLLSALGYFILLYIFIKNRPQVSNIKFLLCYLFTSAFLIWEITTRSNVFTFTILVVILLNQVLFANPNNRFQFYGLAILTGLMLSTRSVYIVPYIIFFLPSIINKEVSLKKTTLFITVAFLAFTASFLPFIYFFPNDFYMMNPFIIQSSFLVPKTYTFIFIMLSIVFAFFVKNNADKYFYSGISLFIIIAIYSGYHLISVGYNAAYINSDLDISYFIFCAPFLIKYLMGIKNNEASIIRT